MSQRDGRADELGSAAGAPLARLRRSSGPVRDRGARLGREGRRLQGGGRGAFGSGRRPGFGGVCDVARELRLQWLHAHNWELRNSSIKSTKMEVVVPVDLRVADCRMVEEWQLGAIRNAKRGHGA